MISLINKFKIPTLLGLGIIFFGIGAGIFLVLRNQSFISQASLDQTRPNITFTNIEGSSITISWQTSQPVASFITFGQENPKQHSALDDKDAQSPKPHTTHHVTIKNLLPKTTYQFKIISGKIASDTNKFTTASPPSTQTGFRPIIGSVLDGDTPLSDGIAYLSIADTVIQSSPVKSSGNFLIPISKISKSDLSDTYPLKEDTTAKLTIISDKGEASALFKLKAEGTQLPSIKLGQDVDLIEEESQNLTPPTISELNRFDLNDDSLINANDHAIVLQNFGPLRPPSREAGSEASKNPKNKKADLNSDGVVDQKDLDLMAKKINQ